MRTAALQCALISRGNFEAGVTPMRLLMLVLLAFSVGPSAIASCPLCPPPRLTWAEAKRDSDALLLATLIRIEKETATKPGAAVFAVRDVLAGRKLVPKGHLRIAGFVYGKPGDLFVLKAAWDDPIPAADLSNEDEPDKTAAVVKPVSGTRKESLIWEVSERLSQQTWDYIKAVPNADADPEVRLTFCLRHLESSDAPIAADAWAEFAKAEYDDIRQLKDQFQAANLRRWIRASDAAPERVNLYALMLGMCGTETDREFFQNRIAREDISFGLEGLLGGLLVLSGRDGLQFIESSLLADPDAGPLRVWAAVQALQFAWNHERESIGPDSLRAALRASLAQESVRDMALTLLTQWQDWTLMKQMPELYEACQGDSRSVKAITAFTLLFQKAHADQETRDQKTAEDMLRQLRQKHPRIVSTLRRSLRIPEKL